jgi:hypothetical protein
MEGFTRGRFRNRKDLPTCMFAVNPQFGVTPATVEYTGSGCRTSHFMPLPASVPLRCTVMPSAMKSRRVILLPVSETTRQPTSPLKSYMNTPAPSGR